MRVGLKWLLWGQWITFSCSVPTKSKPDYSFLWEFTQSPLIWAFLLVLIVSWTEFCGSRFPKWHSGLLQYLLYQPAQSPLPSLAPRAAPHPPNPTPQQKPPLICTWAPHQRHRAQLFHEGHRCDSSHMPLQKVGMAGRITEVEIVPLESLQAITELNQGTPYCLSYCSGSSSCRLLKSLKMRTCAYGLWQFGVTLLNCVKVWKLPGTNSSTSSRLWLLPDHSCTLQLPMQSLDQPTWSHQDHWAKPSLTCNPHGLLSAGSWANTIRTLVQHRRIASTVPNPTEPYRRGLGNFWPQAAGQYRTLPLPPLKAFPL